MKKLTIPNLLILFIISVSLFTIGKAILTDTFNKKIAIDQEASVVNIKKLAKARKKKTLDEINRIRTSETFLSENHYDDIKRRLDDLTKQGVSGLEPYYQAIERLNPRAIAIQDAVRQTAGTTPPKPNCTGNPSPVFTHDITDMSKVQYIVPPPTMGAGPSLKPHSYIGTDHARVPVYAPTDMTVQDGAYSVGGPYMFDFKVSCEVTVRFGHMTDPVDALKKLLPSEPATDSRTNELSPIHFKAGELVGYTTGTDRAGNWDYGVYNTSVTNRYANDPNWGGSATYTTAVCPFDYFTADLKAAYASKFQPEALGGNPPHGESFCKI